MSKAKNLSKVTKNRVRENKIKQLFFFSKISVSLPTKSKANTALKYLYCFGNQIKGDKMQALVNSLPKVSGGNLYVIIMKRTATRQRDYQIASRHRKGQELESV